MTWIGIRLGERGNNQDFNRGILSAALLVIVITGSLGIGIAEGGGGGLACNPKCLTLIQGPTRANVTIASALSTGTKTVIFSPSYSSNPTLSLIPQTLSLTGNPGTIITYLTAFFQSGAELN